MHHFMGITQIAQGLVATLGLLVAVSNFAAAATFEKVPPAQSDVQYQHGYAYISDLKYPSGFEHFDYTNPNAPKTGELRLSELGTWDTFNSATYKGRPQNGVYLWGHEMLLYDRLFVSAEDEPASFYCNLCEGVAYAPNGKWIQYKLRPNAYWHDGEPITVEDFVFTFNVYREALRIEARMAISRLDSIEVIDEDEIRIWVAPDHWNNPVTPLALGNLPILPKHYWQDRDINDITPQPPLGSGPYKPADYQIGSYIRWERVKNWWAKDLPPNRGRYNFDYIRWDYFRDTNSRFEALKSNVIDVREETNPKSWAIEYDFPAALRGAVKKEMQQMGLPGLMWWPILWNQDRERFKDIRVREALWLMYDFEWTNDTLEHGYWDYASSFFLNSPMGHQGLPSEDELKLLEPFRDQVPERVFTQPFSRPPHAGKGWHRDNVRRAIELLAAAGWQLEDGTLVNAKTGEPFVVRLIGLSPSQATHFQPYVKNLQRIGIDASVRALEVSNWLFRMRSGEFDGGCYWFIADNTPGLALMNRFTTASADQDYGENYANIRDPAVDFLVQKVFTARNKRDFYAATRALDRVMMWNFYYVTGRSRTKRPVVYWDKFGRMPIGPMKRRMDVDTWWWDERKAAASGAELDTTSETGAR
ncbi:MAG: ABC transporter substrate-binding protein [Pseudomonadales bacterium]|nr:ABC transporter substrate-binding protein [Pseudomonadales bacterium]